MPTAVDVTFDAVGGRSLLRSRAATKSSGTVVSYGVMGSAGGDAGMIRALGSHLVTYAVTKLTPGARTALFSIDSVVKKEPEAFRRDLATLLDRLRSGRLHPRTHLLPLADAAEAHRMLEGRRVIGKLVLIPEPRPVNDDSPLESSRQAPDQAQPSI